MKTLYDLLGALPDDDSEGLRTAFRRAVKGTHPDIRPGDPDAALRFREIVRAHEILGDSEQRAAYDHLLELARAEHVSALTRVSTVKIRKATSGLITLVAASVATVGAYLLFMHMASALIAVENDVNGRPWPQIASISAPESTSIPNSGVSFEKRFSSDVPIESRVAVPQNSTEGALEPAGIETRFRSPTIAAISIGAASGATTYLAQALRFDPKFLAPAYVDHSTIFYRLRRSDHTFSGAVGASQTAQPSRVKPPTKLTGIPRHGRAAIAHSMTPLPPRQVAAQDLMPVQMRVK